MAIYHLSTKPISRSSGRSAVASVAYRAGIEITDERLGKTYDYTKRSGVIWTGIATPNGIEINRNELWNLAEKTETRSNSRTAREIVINIPHELMQGDQSAGKMLAYEFATSLSQKYGIAVDVAVHAPDKQGDNRNYHAHLLLTDRQLEQDKNIIKLGNKSQLEMSNTQLAKLELPKAQDELVSIRKAWADLTNDYLAEHGLNERIDHRSHADRGLLTLPTVKMGWQATELERQGVRTDVGDQNRAIKAYNEQVLIYQGLQRQARQAELERAEQAERQRQEQTRRQAELEKAKTAQKAQTHENAQKGTLQSDKPKSATLVPTTPPKPLQSENKAVSERFKLTPAQVSQRHEFLEKFHAKIREIAKNIFENELKPLKTKGRELFEQLEKLKNSKPLLWGKDKWEQDKHQAQARFEKVKSEHQAKQELGVTDQHTKLATEKFSKDHPKAYAQARTYTIELAKHEHTLRQERAERMGADQYAKPNQRYNGKIIKSDTDYSLQQTKDGIVYHRLGNLEVGKSYTLSHDNKTYLFQQDYEIRNKNKDQSDQSQERWFSLFGF